MRDVKFRGHHFAVERLAFRKLEADFLDSPAQARQRGTIVAGTDVGPDALFEHLGVATEVDDPGTAVTDQTPVGLADNSAPAQADDEVFPGQGLSERLRFEVAEMRFPIFLEYSPNRLAGVADNQVVNIHVAHPKAVGQFPADRRLAAAAIANEDYFHRSCIIGIFQPCRYNASPMDLKYKRILLKISGEGLCGEGNFGLDAELLRTICRQCVEVTRLGAQLALVVGGGNFLRGSQFAKGSMIQEATAHYMGMLATVINALAIQEIMESLGQPTRVLSALSVYSVCEPFIRRRAVRHMEKGRAIILAGGAGSPCVTTDTCAALRATELRADVVLKATKVDGIYTADPRKDPNARLLADISYEQVLRDKLRVMDLTAITMLMEQKLPLVVFNMGVEGNIMRVARGEPVGTFIRPL